MGATVTARTARDAHKQAPTHMHTDTDIDTHTERETHTP